MRDSYNLRMGPIHIARDGAKLGSFSQEEISEGLRTGKFLLTDLGWQNGMADWRPLAEFSLGPAAAGPGVEVPQPATTLAAAPQVASHAAPGGEEVGLPWEHREQLGFFKAFFDTVSLLITKPTEAFTMMKREGDMVGPLLFLVVGGSAGMIVSLLFQLIMQSLPAFAGGNNLASLFGIGWVIGYMVIMPLLLIVGAFIGSGILHLCLMLVGGANRSFETTLRVVCFSGGAAYLFSMIPICGGMITAVYNIVLECIGLSRAHQTTTGKAIMAILLPLIVCCGVCILFGIVLGGTGVFSEYLKRLN